MLDYDNDNDNKRGLLLRVLIKQQEEIEHAVQPSIASVEERLGVADLGELMAPPPPEQS